MGMGCAPTWLRQVGYMTLPGPSVPGRQFLDRHSNPNPTVLHCA